MSADIKVQVELLNKIKEVCGEYLDPLAEKAMTRADVIETISIFSEFLCRPRAKVSVVEGACPTCKGALEIFVSKPVGHCPKCEWHGEKPMPPTCPHCGFNFSEVNYEIQEDEK